MGEYLVFLLHHSVHAYRPTSCKLRPGKVRIENAQDAVGHVALGLSGILVAADCPYYLRCPAPLVEEKPLRTGGILRCADEGNI